MTTPTRATRGELGFATLALAIVLCFFLRDSLFGGKVLCQADFLLDLPPWNAVAPDDFEAGNPLLEDQGLLMVPWLEFAAERVRAGEAPLWNPYSYAGQPVHAANSAGFLWPLHLLYYASPGFGYYAVAAFLKLLAAGLFTFALLRRLGVSALGALPGAAAFMLSGFLVVWLGHPHSNVALFLPALVLAIERIAARPGLRESALVGLLVGLPLLGGHFQTALYVALIVGAYALVRTFTSWNGARLRGQGWAVLVAGGVLGLGVAMPQVAPFAEYVGASRGSEILESLEQTSDVAPLDAASFLVAPDRFGRPDEGDYAGPVGRNLNYSELAGGFVGRVALLLAALGAFGLARDRRVRFFVVLFAVCALVAWHVPVVYDAARLVPKLRSTNLTRLLLGAAFAQAVLAGVGVDRLLALTRLEGGRARALALVVFGLVAGELVHWGRGFNPEVDAALLYPATPATDFLREQTSQHRVLGVEKNLLRSCGNMPYRLEALTGYDKLELREVNELVLQLTRDVPPVPFLSEVDAFDRTEALPLASLLGVRWILARGALPAPLELVWNGDDGLTIHENPYALPRAFVARDYRLEPDRARRLERMGSPNFDPHVAVLEREPEGELAARALASHGATPAGAVELESYAPRELVLHARMERPGLVVVSDAWMHGWVARVGDAELPIERVDHALRGVFLDAGEHELRLVYDPLSFRLGTWLGLMALLGIALALVADRRGSSGAG